MGEPTALLNELYADDAEFVRPGLRLTSRQAYGDYLKRLVVVSPDAKLSIKRMIGEGETAVAEYEFPAR